MARAAAANKKTRDQAPAILSKGFRNWKTTLEEKCGLVQHAALRGHIATVTIKVRRSSGKTIENQLSGEQPLRNRYYVKSIAEVVRFLAVNELSFRRDNDSIHDGDI